MNIQEAYINALPCHIRIGRSRSDSAQWPYTILRLLGKIESLCDYICNSIQTHVVKNSFAREKLIEGSCRINVDLVRC